MAQLTNQNWVFQWAVKDCNTRNFEVKTTLIFSIGKFILLEIVKLLYMGFFAPFCSLLNITTNTLISPSF